jgi:DNA-binding LacI/PurR family transcriptional regulator
VLALVAPLRADINVPVIMQFVTAVVTAARSFDHDVLLLTNDEGTAGLERVAGAAMVDALIVMDVERDDARLPALRKLRRPSVLIGLPDRPGDISCVDLDFAAAGYACVQHLARHGHRRIGLLGPPPGVYQRGTSYATRFLAGFSDAAADLGVTAATQPCEPTVDGVREAVGHLDAEIAGLTGLVVHNESALMPLLDRLRADGRQVPRDLSVVAVCPRDVALAHQVALTSLDIPANDVGTLAVEMAMGLLQGGRHAETRLLAPTIVERASCADVGA